MDIGRDYIGPTLYMGVSKKYPDVFVYHYGSLLVYQCGSTYHVYRYAPKSLTAAQTFSFAVDW